MAGFRSPNYQQVGEQMLTMMSGPLLTAADRERIKVSFMSTPQHVVVGAMEGMVDKSIWGLDKINVPVLALMARNPMYPADMEQSYRTTAPNLDYQMWGDVGHFLMMEKPKEFNAAVIAFLDKNKLLRK
jgi:pimeloyl-ACP methyl ester carboxylesterase